MFTLRASRRGRLEAGDWKERLHRTCRDSSRQRTATPEGSPKSFPEAPFGNRNETNGFFLDLEFHYEIKEESKSKSRQGQKIFLGGKKNLQFVNYNMLDNLYMLLCS